MKKSILLFLFAVAIFSLITGCFEHTAWVRNTQQTRGNVWGVMTPREAVKIENQVIKNDYLQGHTQNILEKERMLNKYTQKELEGNDLTAGMSGIPGHENMLGLGFPGIVMNRDTTAMFQIQITSETGEIYPFLLNPLSEDWFKLPSGKYKCQLNRNGINWGPPSFFTVNGQLKTALGKKVYWYCSTPTN